MKDYSKLIKGFLIAISIAGNLLLGVKAHSNGVKLELTTDAYTIMATIVANEHSE